MGRKRVLFVTGVLVLAGLFSSAPANASQLVQAGLRLGRLGNGASANNDLFVTFKLLTTPGSVAKVIITIPSGFTLTAGTPTPVITNLPDTPVTTGLPGTLTSSVTSAGAGLGGTITISTTATLTGAPLYGVDIPTGSITNPTTAGQYLTTVASANSSSTPIDTTTVPVYIYGTSANQDQVAVSASVAPNFTFALSANADTLPKVDPTSIQTSTGVTMTVSTNSPLGYTAYVKSQNGALDSPTQPTSPIPTGTFDNTPDSMPVGSAKYDFVPTTGTACTTCSGTLTYNGEYAIIDGTHGGAFNGTNFASFVSRNGYTNADAIILKERVTVSSAIIDANDYADSLTIVAAGNF